jgi:hypothetical protein
MVEEEWMRRRQRRPRGNERELAAELKAHRGDPGEWSETPVPAEIRAQRAVVTSVRLPVSEFLAIQKAAKAGGQTVSEFIRSAVAQRLRRPLLVNALQIVTGSSSRGPSSATFLAPELEAGRTQNPGPAREDRIPQYANLTR